MVPRTPEQLAQAYAAGLIILPEGVTGTNCGNCSWFSQEKVFCNHPQVNQALEGGPLNCCNFWTQPGMVEIGKPVTPVTPPGDTAMSTIKTQANDSEVKYKDTSDQNPENVMPKPKEQTKKNLDAKPEEQAKAGILPETKELRVAAAKTDQFERGTYKTYALDEGNGVKVVVAKHLKEGVIKAQSFVFDLTKNPHWDFSKAKAYVEASLADVNKLAAAVKGSFTFKTLAQAANAGERIPLDQIRKGLHLASLDPKVAELLVAKQKDDKAAEIDFSKTTYYGNK